VVLAFEDYARQIDQHHFDRTYLIDATARAIYIFDANGYSLDRIRELPKLHSEFPAKILPLSLVETCSQYSDVSGHRNGHIPAGVSLDASRQPSRERRPLKAATHLFEQFGLRD
jgi:hypothetical protein